jgi:sarcosine oxidase subunit gamma
MERPLMADQKSKLLAKAASSSGTVTATRIENATRFALRISPLLAAEVAKAGGFDLTGPLNTVFATGELLSARIGPDEWLLIAPDGLAESLTDAIERDLAGKLHALVDISHRNKAIVVEGTEAATVLNAGVPIDLSDAAFPPGSSTRTVLGKAEIVLMREKVGHRYRVECGRSFAPYVYAFVEEAGREFAVS